MCFCEIISTFIFKKHIWICRYNYVSHKLKLPWVKTPFLSPPGDSKNILLRPPQLLGSSLTCSSIARCSSLISGSGPDMSAVCCCSYGLLRSYLTGFIDFDHKTTSTPKRTTTHACPVFKSEDAAKTNFFSSWLARKNLLVWLSVFGSSGLALTLALTLAQTGGSEEAITIKTFYDYLAVTLALPFCFFAV